MYCIVLYMTLFVQFVIYKIGIEIL